MKKKTLGLTLFIAGGLVLTGCQNLPLTNSEAGMPVIQTKTMAFQATTAISLVKGLSVPTKFSAMSETTEIPSDEVTQEENNIPVATLDLLFTNGSGFSVEQKESDREGYTNLDVISFLIMDEQTTSYSLYYNATPLEADDTLPGEDVIDEEASEELETPILSRHGEDSDKQDDDDDSDGQHHGSNNGNNEQTHSHNHDNDKDQDHDRNHQNDELKITGIAVVGEEEYQFVSKTEIDNDSDEQEIEMKFMIFKDKDNFISIKQEIEIEGVEGSEDYEYEEEFKYTVVENGQVVRKFKLEIENEDNELQLEVKIDGVKYEIEYEVVEDRVFLHITVKGQGEFIYEKIVTVNEDTNETNVDYIIQ